MENRKLYIVFGAGRLGTEIVKALIDDGEEVLVVDIKDMALQKLKESHNHIQVLCLDHNPSYWKIKLQTKLIELQNTQSIVAFHTFLYTPEDLQNWVELMLPYTTNLGFMSTTLGYDRSQIDFTKRSQIYASDPKINPDINSTYGGYVNGKMQIEILAKKFEQKYTGLKFFIAEANHILGAGWPLGCAASPSDMLFRRGDILQTIRSGKIYIPFAGSNQIQGIHVSDLSKMIALGMRFDHSGNFPLVSPEIWRVKHYFKTIADLIGVGLDILPVDISEVEKTLMMTLDHLHTPTALHELFQKSGFKWTQLTESLKEMVDFYLFDELKPASQKQITHLGQTDIGIKMNKLPLANPYQKIIQNKNLI
jgi:nucleoside-diphosphate-sugar epimerase